MTPKPESLVRVSIGDQGFNDDGNAGVGSASIVGAVSEISHAIQRVAIRRCQTMVRVCSSRVLSGLTPHALNDVVIGHTEGEVPSGSGK